MQQGALVFQSVSFIHSKDTPREAVRENPLSALCNSERLECYRTATTVRKTITAGLETRPKHLPTDWTTAVARGGSFKELPPKTEKMAGRKEPKPERGKTFITKCPVLNL